MYLFGPPIQIVTSSQYDLSCKEILDLNPLVGNLPPTSTRGVADLLTISGSTSITAVGMPKNVVPFKCWSVSRILLLIYVLIANRVFST